MKRFIDVTGASLLLLLALPILSIVAIIVYIDSGPPILFRQTRPGQNGTPFQMIKFRTMRPLEACGGAAATDEERLTPVGKWLRATSLDELPELWNVLRGDMSLVGPRPLLMDYVPLYTERQSKRQDIKPGITGWAQVNGRNSVSWEERFEMDVWYVENRSLTLDLRILWLTIVKVLKREGINAEGAATMARFRGSKEEEK